MIGKILLAATAAACTLPLVHPFGAVREQRSERALPEMPSLARVCQNCHSERTEWPWYSRVPAVSWMLERDVAKARKHLNFSNWAAYSKEEQRDLLTRIGVKVRSHAMPPWRYQMLHPEARLSEAEVEAIAQWTKEQRRLLRE